MKITPVLLFALSLNVNSINAFASDDDLVGTCKVGAVGTSCDSKDDHHENHDGHDHKDHKKNKKAAKPTRAQPAANKSAEKGHK